MGSDKAKADTLLLQLAFDTTQGQKKILAPFRGHLQAMESIVRDVVNEEWEKMKPLIATALVNNREASEPGPSGAQYESE